MKTLDTLDFPFYGSDILSNLFCHLLDLRIECRSDGFGKSLRIQLFRRDRRWTGAGPIYRITPESAVRAIGNDYSLLVPKEGNNDGW